MGPLLALGIGLLPGLIGGLFGKKEAPPAPPPPKDNTEDLLKAMKEQHATDMAVINKLIDKLDAKNNGTPSQIGLGNGTGTGQPTAATPDGKGGPASPIAAGTGNGPAAANADPAKPANPAVAPKPVGGDDLQNSLLGIIKELTKLAGLLTELVSKLIPAAPPAPKGPPPPGMVPLKADPAKAGVN
jgi:hypothetical protein